ncbi:hypothetical protein PM082_021952 [Marasmius tenuissimus]|nr:hypothetical protein PM082_021952 [Marasmius tenuissimus]
MWLCVCALYGYSKNIKGRLGALLVVCIACSTAVIGVVGSRTRGTADPVPGVQRCVVVTWYSFLWLFWIPILAYESTTLLLVLRKCHAYFNNGTLSPSLVFLLLRNMTLYLIIVFVLYIANAVLFANPDPSLSGILAPVTLVVLSICGNRMLFDLREEEDRSMQGGVRTGEATVGTMHFAMSTFEPTSVQ